jgi:hypothetical protein
MYKSLLITLHFLAYGYINNLGGNPVTSYTQLVMNMENQSVLPPMFRMTTDILKIPINHYSQAISLAKLNASASGQFSEYSLETMIKALPTSDVIIVDLREESHGFLNGVAVSWRGVNDWANVGKSIDEVEQDEASKLKQMLEQGYTLIHDKDHPRAVYSLYIDTVCTEEELVLSKGVAYKHIPVTNHVRPSDAIVDRFIKFIQHLPLGTWLHFHCSAGKGRSTTFLALYDMLRNGRELTVNDVFERQQIIGGKDFNLPVDPTLWKYPLAVERIEFLKEFFQYCQECDPFTTPWSEWVMRR